MRRVYYTVKRRVRPLLCLFGRHDYKMGLTDKTGRPFACLWCRKRCPYCRDASQKLINKYGPGL